jgi:hypothetical protein
VYRTVFRIVLDTLSGLQSRLKNANVQSGISHFVRKCACGNIIHFANRGNVDFCQSVAEKGKKLNKLFIKLEIKCKIGYGLKKMFTTGKFTILSVACAKMYSNVRVFAII